MTESWCFKSFTDSKLWVLLCCFPLVTCRCLRRSLGASSDLTLSACCCCSATSRCSRNRSLGRVLTFVFQIPLTPPRSQGLKHLVSCRNLALPPLHIRVTGSLIFVATHRSRLRNSHLNDLNQFTSVRITSGKTSECWQGESLVTRKARFEISTPTLCLSTMDLCRLYCTDLPSKGDTQSYCHLGDTDGFQNTF